MQFYVGTSGYSYKEWKGSFYPEKLPAAKMLPFYAERFSTVEINNTFYRMPKAEVLTQWAEQVPPAFAFVLKAPQRITHFQQLRLSDDSLTYFANTAAVLGARLGPLLFQLPPTLKKDVPRLREFLQALPDGPRAAFEFRHASWADDETCALLSAAGAALVAAETDEELLSDLRSTAKWGYLRLRRTEYSDDDLKVWLERIRRQTWEQAFVFFKHEDEARGPRFATRFLELLRAE